MFFNDACVNYLSWFAAANKGFSKGQLQCSIPCEFRRSNESRSSSKDLREYKKENKNEWGLTALGKERVRKTLYKKCYYWTMCFLLSLDLSEFVKKKNTFFFSNSYFLISLEKYTQNPQLLLPLSIQNSP